LNQKVIGKLNSRLGAEKKESLREDALNPRETKGA